MVLGDRTKKKKVKGGQLTNTPQGVKVDNLLTLKHIHIYIYSSEVMAGYVGSGAHYCAQNV